MRRTRFDTSRLAPGIWFVRSNRGRSLFPVTPEGNRVVRRFLAGVAASSVAGGGLTIVTDQIGWMAVFAAGTAAAAAWFIITAYRHADMSVRVGEIVIRDDP